MEESSQGTSSKWIPGSSLKHFGGASQLAHHYGKQLGIISKSQRCTLPMVQQVYSMEYNLENLLDMCLGKHG